MPTHECLKEDSKRRRGVGLAGLEFLRGAYKQPELAAEKEMLVAFADPLNNLRRTTGMTKTMAMAQDLEMERGTRENNTYGSGLPANVDVDATLKEAALAVNEMQSMRQGHAVLSSASPPPSESLFNNQDQVPSGRALAADRDSDDDNDSLSESPSSVVSSFLNSFSFASLPTSKMNNNRRQYHLKDKEHDH